MSRPTKRKTLLSRVTRKGQVTIPAEFRRSHHITEGSTVVFSIKKTGELTLTSMPNLEDLAGVDSKSATYQESVWLRIYVNRGISRIPTSSDLSPYLVNTPVRIPKRVFYEETQGSKLWACFRWKTYFFSSTGSRFSIPRVS
jgi:AbrB family looped-hinge helix DNA binding protein